MAGLRGLLDKRRSNAEPARKPVEPGAPRAQAHAGNRGRRTRILITNREASREGLLAELLGMRQQSTELAKIIGKAIDTGDSAPWWLHDPPRNNSALDLLIPQARRLLVESVGARLDSGDLAQTVKRAVGAAADELAAKMQITQRDIKDAENELLSLVGGKGPLEPLFSDPWVTDIFVDGYDRIRCLRLGQALESPFRFRSAADYEVFYTALLQSAHRSVSRARPVVNCILPDAWRTRVNAVHGSLREGGEVSLVVRVPRLQSASLYDLLRSQTMPAALAAWVTEVVSFGELNILVVGPTGAGKTTLANALLSAVGSDERVCVIEELPELHVSSCQIERLLISPPSARDEGTATPETIFEIILRRPAHRVVVGELRSDTADILIGAIETGHSGSFATMHAENSRDALTRLVELTSLEKVGNEARIGRAINLVITLKRVDGRPCVSELAEVVHHEREGLSAVPLVRFEGTVGERRVWRRVINESRLLSMMQDRGVELFEGPTLLPVEDRILTDDEEAR